jgi:hypothetical protein
MIASSTCVIVVFTLFFLQDLVNAGLLKAGLGDWIIPFSALKEAAVAALVLSFFVLHTPRLRFQSGRVALALALATTVAIGLWQGIAKFPLDGVLFELRTLLLPIAIYLWGVSFVGAGTNTQYRIERVVGFYITMCTVIAASAVLDYCFLDDSFWTSVDIGGISLAKGYAAVTTGPLPGNMYSYFFGRRAFGLAFDPLNLAYLLVPGLILAFYRRRFFQMLVMIPAFVLSFSRLPILGSVAAITIFALPAQTRIIALSLGAISATLAVYLGRVTLFADPSANQHFMDVAQGAIQQIGNVLGEGVGAAGVFAGNYSILSLESAVLNTANQIGFIGLIAYIVFLAGGLHRQGVLSRELRLIAMIYFITSIFSPQVLVIRSTFAFFFLLGVSAATAGVRSAILVVPRSVMPSAADGRTPAI